MRWDFPCDGRDVEEYQLWCDARVLMPSNVEDNNVVNDRHEMHKEG